MSKYVDKHEASKIIGCTLDYFESARGKKTKIKYPNDNKLAINALQHKKVSGKAGSCKYLYLKAEVEKLAKETPYTCYKQTRSKAKHTDYTKAAMAEWREVTGLKTKFPYQATPEQQQLHFDLLQKYKSLSAHNRSKHSRQGIGDEKNAA